MVRSDSKLVDLKLPSSAARRNLAVANCDARDASMDPWSQKWKIPPDPRPWELVKSINKQLKAWPPEVPKNDHNCVALKDGTIPCWFRLEGSK